MSEKYQKEKEQFIEIFEDMTSDHWHSESELFDLYIKPILEKREEKKKINIVCSMCGETWAQDHSCNAYLSHPKEELPVIKHKKLIDPVENEKLAKKVRKSFVEEQKYLDKLEFERRLENR